MKNENLDERQKLVNYRLSHHALMIVFVMLIVNGLLKSVAGITWADPVAEMMVFIAVPGLYYITRSIFQDAYMGKRDTVRKNVVTFLLLAVLFILASIFIYDEPVVDGMLTDTAAPLIAGVFFIIISALHGVKLLTDKDHDA